MLQAITFDYDGTIAPTSQRQEKWFKFYAERNNKPWPFATFGAFMTFYNYHLSQKGGAQNVYDTLGLPCDMKDKKHPVWPAYESFNQNNPQALYPEMKETLETIFNLGVLTKDTDRNRRLRLGINTTNTWASIYKDLNQAGVLHYFDCYITDEVLRKYQGLGVSEQLHKPSSISLALMLGLLDSEGAYTLHVGDTRNDLRASQKVIRLNPQRPENILTVGACYGYEGRTTLENGVETPEGTAHFNYLIDEPKQLVTIVKELLEAK